MGSKEKSQSAAFRSCGNFECRRIWRHHFVNETSLLLWASFAKLGVIGRLEVLQYPKSWAGLFVARMVNSEVVSQVLLYISFLFLAKLEN